MPDEPNTVEVLKGLEQEATNWLHDLLEQRSRLTAAYKQLNDAVCQTTHEDIDSAYWAGDIEKGLATELHRSLDSCIKRQSGEDNELLEIDALIEKWTTTRDVLQRDIVKYSALEPNVVASPATKGGRPKRFLAWLALIGCFVVLHWIVSLSEMLLDYLSWRSFQLFEKLWGGALALALLLAPAVYWSVLSYSWSEAICPSGRGARYIAVGAFALLCFAFSIFIEFSTHDVIIGVCGFIMIVFGAQIRKAAGAKAGGIKK